MTKRLDQVMVSRGLAESRARAQALIKAGVVRVDGAKADKPARQIDGEEIEVIADPNPWVSRGALKLVHALDQFRLNPEGAIAADVGASTGGFTQVLLARGAVRVYAIDVGKGQLHPALQGDLRVENLEGVNARDLPDLLVPPVDWITCDVSFISQTKVLPRLMAEANPGAILVSLIKPQFELAPADIGKGGIVRDATARARACEAVVSFVSLAGWQVLGVIRSPIEGGDGNEEFLLAARKPLTPPPPPEAPAGPAGR